MKKVAWDPGGYQALVEGILLSDMFKKNMPAEDIAS
jgi:hypothetical protein